VPYPSVTTRRYTNPRVLYLNLWAFSAARTCWVSWRWLFSHRAHGRLFQTVGVQNANHRCPIDVCTALTLLQVAYTNMSHGSERARMSWTVMEKTLIKSLKKELDECCWFPTGLQHQRHIVTLAVTVLFSKADPEKEDYGMHPPSPASAIVADRLTWRIQNDHMQSCKQNWLSVMKKCSAFGGVASRWTLSLRGALPLDPPEPPDSRHPLGPSPTLGRW